MKNTKPNFIDLMVDGGDFASREDMFDAAVTDGICTAICTNLDCLMVTEMEPDQDRGYCSECEGNKVKSCLIIAGLI